MKYWCYLAFSFCFGSVVFASPVPMPGSEDIPKLMADSALVCKGEVVDAPASKWVPSLAGMPRMTATAQVRADRCFKGMPEGTLIRVLVDGLVTRSDPPSFVLVKGDYRLFFLKPVNGKYTVVDESFGALPVSRELSSTQEGADPLFLLELDLKAGLRDSDRERMLDSIQMLGDMKRLHSTAELKQLLNNPDLLVNAYVWQALLRLKDYSVLPAVETFFDSQPEPPRELTLPRDRLLFQQDELARATGAIRDPQALLFLERFAVSNKWFLRMNALDALRAIKSLHSAPTFLKELDDPNTDNGFSAMQGLLTLAGGGAIDWVPTWPEFREAPQFYAAKCREWWFSEGQRRAGQTASSRKQLF